MIRHLYRVSAALLLVLLILVPVNAAQTCPPSRLKQGEQAQVVGTPNRLRDAASTGGTRIGEIPPGEAFTVLETGDCEGGIRWARVSYNGQEGWTAEGSGAEYYIEPVTADAGLQKVSVGGVIGDYEWVTEDTYAVLTDDGIILYAVSDPNTPLRFLPINEKFHRLAAHPSLPGILLAFDPFTLFVVYDVLNGTELFRATGAEPEQYGNEDAFDLRPQPPSFVLDGQQLHLQTVDEHVIVRTADWQIVDRIAFENTLRVQVFISPDARWQAQTVGLLYFPDADEARLPLFDRQANSGVMLERGGITTQINVVTYSHDSRYLIAYDDNDNVQVWDLSQNPLQRTDYSAAAWLGASLENRYAVEQPGYRVIARLDTSNFVRPQREIVVFAPDGTSPVRIVQAGRGFLNGSVSRDGSSLLIVTDQNELFLGSVAALAQRGLVELEAPSFNVAGTPVQFRCGAETTPFTRNSQVVVTGELPARLRAAPSTDAPVLRGVEPGNEMQLMGQGLCINGITWRQVTVLPFENRDFGWVAESIDGEQLLEAVEAGTQNLVTSPLQHLALSNSSVDLYGDTLNVLNLPLRASIYTSQDTLLTSDNYQDSMVGVYHVPNQPNEVYILYPYHLFWRHLVTGEMTEPILLEQFGIVRLALVPAAQAGSIVYLVVDDLPGARIIRLDLNNGQVSTAYETAVKHLVYARASQDYVLDETLLALTISPDGRTVAQVIRSETDTRLELFDVASGAVRTLAGFQVVRGSEEAAAVFSPDGSQLAVTTVDSKEIRLTLWDVAEGSMILSDNIPYRGRLFGERPPLFFSSDGRWLVARARVYDASDGERVADGVAVRAFTPDSRIAGVLFDEQTTSRIVLLDTTTWESIGEIVLPDIEAPVSP